MKEKIQKVIGFLKWIFGYMIMITLFVGGLTFFGYLIALIIGGSNATAICVFIYEKMRKQRTFSQCIKIYARAKSSKSIMQKPMMSTKVAPTQTYTSLMATPPIVRGVTVEHALPLRGLYLEEREF